MVTDINSPKTCANNNWCSGEYKLRFFESLTEDNLTEFIHSGMWQTKLRNTRKGTYIYDVHIKKSGGFLKFVLCLQIPLFLKNRFVHFCGWWRWEIGVGVGVGVSFIDLLVISCGHRNWVTSEKANISNRNGSDILEILIIRHTIT